MSALTYNSAMLAGLILVTGGVRLIAGDGPAMVVAGVLVIGLTLFGASMARRK